MKRDAGRVKGYGAFGKFLEAMDSMVKEGKLCFGGVYMGTQLAALGKILG